MSRKKSKTLFFAATEFISRVPICSVEWNGCFEGKQRRKDSSQPKNQFLYYKLKFKNREEKPPAA
jgi:hypothetical protein